MSTNVIEYLELIIQIAKEADANGVDVKCNVAIDEKIMQAKEGFDG